MVSQVIHKDSAKKMNPIDFRNGWKRNWQVFFTTTLQLKNEEIDCFWSIVRMIQSQNALKQEDNFY
jgi:hypothetical protein